MPSFTYTVLMAASAALVSAKTIIMPATASKGTDIAIIWVHGAHCDNAAYQTIAQEVMDQGAKKDQKIWVGLPDFFTGIPDPVTISHEVSSTIKSL